MDEIEIEALGSATVDVVLQRLFTRYPRQVWK
jgi:hypothetical protein